MDIKIESSEVYRSWDWCPSLWLDMQLELTPHGNKGKFGVPIVKCSIGSRLWPGLPQLFEVDVFGHSLQELAGLKKCQNGPSDEYQSCLLALQTTCHRRPGTNRGDHPAMWCIVPHMDSVETLAVEGLLLPQSSVDKLTILRF